MHDNLYKLRRESRLNKQDMSRLLLITGSTYSKKERGVSEFTISEAITLAKYFEVTLDELFISGVEGERDRREFKKEKEDSLKRADELAELLKNILKEPVLSIIEEEKQNNNLKRARGQLR